MPLPNIPAPAPVLTDSVNGLSLVTNRPIVDTLGWPGFRDKYELNYSVLANTDIWTTEQFVTATHAGSTATQYFRFEVLSNGALIGALQITPSLVPGVAASISGRQVDILFDLAPTAAAWGDGSSVATRMHATSFFEGGAQSGTGNSLVGLGYLFEHETYPGNINFTSEQMLTARVAATGGQTVYVNSIRWWI